MIANPVAFDAFASVFTVADVGLSLQFFVDRLGFREHFRMSDLSYAIVDRDCVSVHLMPTSQGDDALGKSSIYIFVSDVDALHAELQTHGCPIEVPPEDFLYGMREMSVRDPDGNRLTFAREVKKPA
jgi:catechol 2,3-dioxygenase-like lactoylglutathione lyase family enzyme